MLIIGIRLIVVEIWILIGKKKNELNKIHVCNLNSKPFHQSDLTNINNRNTNRSNNPTIRRRGVYE